MIIKILNSPNSTEKLLELVISVYIVAVGVLFIFKPEVLSAPVYSEWQKLGPKSWGVALLITSLFHLSALWWNGRNNAISRPLRVVGLFFHCCISFNFGLMFGQVGAWWGVMTFWILVPGVLAIVARSVLIEHFTGVQYEPKSERFN